MIDVLLTKTCFRCGVSKPIDCFYVHSEMSDGRLGKCKECCIREATDRHYLKYQNPIFVESERSRGRERYHRLSYRERQIELNLNKPWKKESSYKGIHKKLKTRGLIVDGEVAHHYDYNFLNSVFVLDKLDHRRLHVWLKFDMPNKCFVDDNGVLLDTLYKHSKFIESKGIKFRHIEL